MGGRRLIEGMGFRVGWDPDGGEFVGLVGTEEWAIELTAAEWTDFARLATQLSETMAAMTTELMDEESMSVELESDRLWIEVQGDPTHYGLRFMVQEGRCVEGAWKAEGVPGLLKALVQLDSERGERKVRDNS